MEEREEMTGVGIRHLDFAELEPIEARVSLPSKRYAPRGRQRKQRQEVRNSLASAIAIRTNGDSPTGIMTCYTPCSSWA